MNTVEALEATLLELAPALALAQRPWWIIASAAVQLHTGADLAIRDVDLLIDPQDVPDVFGALGLAMVPGEGDERFRSAWFARYNATPLPVELFAGFELCEKGQWQQVQPTSRIELVCGQARAFVPDAAELTALLHRFGRDKDVARAALLSASN